MSLSYQTHKVNINLTEKQTLSVNNKIWQKKKKKKLQLILVGFGWGSLFTAIKKNPLEQMYIKP